MKRKTLPFKRIAILDVSRLLSTQGREQTQQDLYQKVDAWSHRALTHGMDACYVRLHPASEESVDAILAPLRKQGIPFLLPVTLQSTTDGIAGQHWRETDPLPTTPKHKDGLLYGKSCHSLVSIQEAEACGMDYLFFSPIFDTLTHPDVKGIGLDALREACRSTPLPIFALGGINQDNYQQCLDVGAVGIAAISLFTS